jgi:CYTH domain-containing protein
MLNYHKKVFKIIRYKEIMDEIERRFLVKELPEDLDKYPFEVLEDNYVPLNRKHPIIRIRRIGNKFFITKKTLQREDSHSFATEETIILDDEEYEFLKNIPGKKLKKKRYRYKYNGMDCEIDVYEGDLKGLVMIDFEFDNEEEFRNFEKPDFCLEVEEEELIAGGYLCGKSYEDIKENLEKYGYKGIGV